MSTLKNEPSKDVALRLPAATLRDRDEAALRKLAFAKLREAASQLSVLTALLFGSLITLLQIYVLPPAPRPELVPFCGSAIGFAIGAILGLVTPLGSRIERRATALLRGRTVGALELLRELKEKHLIDDDEYRRRVALLMRSVFGEDG